MKKPHVTSTKGTVIFFSLQLFPFRLTYTVLMGLEFCNYLCMNAFFRNVKYANYNTCHLKTYS